MAPRKQAKKTSKDPKKKAGKQGIAIDAPLCNDVLCGRGGSINSHPGNIQFREMVEKHREVYLKARFKQEKRLVAETIVSDIRALDPPGRFLAKNTRKGTWYDIGDLKARDKTSQALRENAPSFREVMLIPQQQSLRRQSTPLSLPEKTKNVMASIDAGRPPLASVRPQLPASLQPRYNVTHAQLGYPFIHPPGPLHIPPPPQLASHILQANSATATEDHPPRAAVVHHLNQHAPQQQSQYLAATTTTDLTLATTRSMSWSTSTSNSPDGDQRQLHKEEVQQGKGGILSIPKHDITPLFAGSKSVPSLNVASSTNGTGEKNWEIPPPQRRQETTSNNTPQRTRDHDLVTSEGHKRAIHFHEHNRVHGDKRYRGNYDAPSTHSSQQERYFEPPSKPPHQESSRSGNDAHSQATSMTIATPVVTSFGLNKLQYSPIRTGAKKCVDLTASSRQEGEEMSSRQQDSESAPQSNDSSGQTGSFFSNMTQHILSSWDADVVCGGGAESAPCSNEHAAPKSQMEKQTYSTPTRKPKRNAMSEKNLQQQGEQSAVKMDYDPSSPMPSPSLSFTVQNPGTPPSWEITIQKMSPSSFRLRGWSPMSPEPTPTPRVERDYATRPVSQLAQEVTYAEPTGNMVQFLKNEGMLNQEEDPDGEFVVALQQENNAPVVSEVLGDVVTSNNTNRTAQSQKKNVEDHLVTKNIVIPRSNNTSSSNTSNSSLESIVPENPVGQNTVVYVHPPGGTNGVPREVADESFEMQLMMMAEPTHDADTAHHQHEEIEAVSKALQQDEGAQC